MKILLLGSVQDAHLNRFINNLKLADKTDSISIDVFDIWGVNENNNRYINNLYSVRFHFKSFLYNIPVLSSLCHIIDYRISFRKVSNQYDIVNIHYVTALSYYILDMIKCRTAKIVVTPWGSDIYRIKESDKGKVRKVLKNGYAITYPHDRMKYDIQKIFSLGSAVFVQMYFGSETIDSLLHMPYNQTEAKEKLGFAKKYIIVCGYNRVPEQNHENIITALVGVKKRLPNNTMLVFPFNYGICPNNYKIYLTSKLMESGFEYRFFDNYLTNEENALLRISADMFIHIQTTDANSATIQEFLLTDTVVFNGAWLKYPLLEQHNQMPYIRVDSINDLSSKIVQYFNGNILVSVSNECKEIINSNSWSNRGKEWFNYFKKISSI